MRHDLLGLAENPALPTELVDRPIAAADTDLAEVLARRPDLIGTQVAALARFEGAAVRLARDGRLAAEDVDPLAQPRVTLEAGSGRPEWTRLLAADPLVDNREKLAACPGLPRDVTQTLASDPDVRVVAELAPWLGDDLAYDAWNPGHGSLRAPRGT
ncbi:hypothetical protein [Nocardia sp. NBC_00403]|uniref:hypothetical protein n=1 Tax=Nocardia sp. NBC_00403 TaxID=2975990 RepID=UPI002E20ED1F